VLDKLSAMSPDRTPEGDMRLLAMLVFAVPKEDISPLIGRLNMDGRWAKVVRDVAAVRDSFDKLEGESISRSRVFALLRHLDPASVAGCALATDQPLVEQRLELYLTELRPVRPLLNGNGLIALGVPEGPEVGRLLEVILMARLDGLLSTREDEENLVVRSMERGGEVSSGSSTTRGLFPTCRDSAPQKDS
jgi:tRNA nucleotidyltransferase (CCA-adding enzyme)